MTESTTSTTADVPRIKICGLTRAIDIQVAIDAGAHAVGFVFYPPSPRAVTKEQAVDLVRSVPPFVQAVGLFVNVSELELVDILADVHLDLLQFHGDETPEDCERLGQLTGKRWIKALAMKPDVDIQAQIREYQAAGASGILLDAWHPKLYGGTGEAFDWNRFPHDVGIPLILAGGLNADNVQAAIHAAQPFAVDVSGGVEEAKGIKSQALIERFVAQVRSA